MSFMASPTSPDRSSDGLDAMYGSTWPRKVVTRITFPNCDDHRRAEGPGETNLLLDLGRGENSYCCWGPRFGEGGRNVGIGCCGRDINIFGLVCITSKALRDNFSTVNSQERGMITD